MSQGQAEEASFDLLMDSVRWKEVRGLRPRLGKAAGMVLAHLPARLRKKAAGASWCVLLTTDAAVKRMNREFRGVDKPTNVLSFPSAPDPARPGFIGDIAIAYQYVAKESRQEQKIFLDHLTHLVIHGLLHLFGYDHMTEADAGKMERLETKIMAALGLADPYAPLTGEQPKVKAKKAKKTTGAPVRKRRAP